YKPIQWEKEIYCWTDHHASNRAVLITQGCRTQNRSLIVPPTPEQTQIRSRDRCTATDIHAVLVSNRFCREIQRNNEGIFTAESQNPDSRPHPKAFCEVPLEICAVENGASQALKTNNRLLCIRHRNQAQSNYYR